MNQRYLCAMQEAAADTVYSITTDSAAYAMAEQDSVEFGALTQDSIAVTAVEPPATSLFEGHQLQSQNGFSYLERVDSVGSFGFFVLLACAAVIVYLQRSSDSIFSHVIKASFNINQAAQDARIDNSQRSRNLLAIEGVSVISISLFAAGAFTHISQSYIPLSQVFFSVLGVLLLAILFKRVVLWILAQLFDLNSELRFHRFNLKILFSAAGLTLLPLSLLLLYSPQLPFNWIIYLGIGVAVLFYIKGLQRGISVAITSSSVSALHLFYYFCALEILPVFVLIRCAQSL